MSSKKHLILLFLVSIIIIPGVALAVFGVSGKTDSLEPSNLSSYKIEELNSKGKDLYEIELDLPSHIPQELRHPQKFFSDRKIKIINKNGSFKLLSDEIILSNRDKNSKKLLSYNKIKIEKKSDNSFSFKIPKGTKTRLSLILMVKGSCFQLK